ncbi:class I SAM-dependent methyltransferase [Candidatus Giovannonibacteria bacterium]|nr:class I SAM-dependent methyltransferase [Candidatus Giovannonibacteria bacterium]
MNSTILIKKLIDENSKSELNEYLSNVWNSVWTDKGKYNYANLRLFKTADKIRNIIEMGVDFKNKSVLDIGCGNGTTLMYLRKCFDVNGVGIDISDNAIRDLRSSISDNKLSFYLGDHRNLQELKNDQFDIVLSFGVIEHFEEYNLALAEARRVLKKGGSLVLIQPHLLSFGVLQKYFLRVFGKWKFGKQKDFSFHYYCSLLRKLGFNDILYSTFPPYPDMRITRMLDKCIKPFIPFWGHYLYLTAKK